MAGYSGTPLIRKLGLKPGMTAVVLNPPWPYAETLGHASGIRELGPDATLPAGLDFIHIFTPFHDELQTALTNARSALAPAGMIWVSWPKKATKLYSEITEDTVRELCLPMGLVDIKVCAVDEIWSGLKLVIRKELR
ncbi:MAG: DUF3052 domain-containing protein [Paracoccaceae bacterium]|nr:DUF3052 domain-containing protein [Paracoccaceae bacterium]